MVQIWRGPVRVDSKTIWRPSGAQLGRSLRHQSRGVRLMMCCEVGVHDVDIVVAIGAAPAEGQELAVG